MTASDDQARPKSIDDDPISPAVARTMAKATQGITDSAGNEYGDLVRLGLGDRLGHRAELGFDAYTLPNRDSEDRTTIAFLHCAGCNQRAWRLGCSHAGGWYAVEIIGKVRLATDDGHRLTTLITPTFTAAEVEAERTKSTGVGIDVPLWGELQCNRCGTRNVLTPDALVSLVDRHRDGGKPTNSTLTKSPGQH